MDSSKPDYSLLATLEPRAARPRSSVLYHVSVVVMAVVVMVLPLSYLALVGVVARLVYYHAVYHWDPIMGMDEGRGGLILLILKAIIYLGPLITGLVVLFFMFKPLLARRPSRAPPFALKPAENPLLYAFIESICACVGAPSPTRIDLNCELNASAGFRRGWLSMAGHDLVLTLGLPFVANLTVTEFAGVVAHEFGHFTQGISMRLRYVSFLIMSWFARVAYQRDVWDLALEEWAAQTQDLRLAVIVWLAQLGVFFARLVLKTLLYIGALATGFMLRQAEFQADTCAIQIGGSQSFESTERKLATLNAASRMMYSQMHRLWQQTGQLPDNLSELLRIFHEQLPASVLQRIDDTLGLHPTRIFDTHPSPADRIRKARQAQAPGLVHDSRPATSLFRNFEIPARLVTMEHYACDLGIHLTERTLARVTPRDPAAVSPAASRSRTLDEYFMGLVPLLLPFSLEPPQASTKLEEDNLELIQLAAGLAQVRDRVQGLVREHQEASARWCQARVARCLLEAGAPFQPKKFGLEAGTREAIGEAEQETKAGQTAVLHAVGEVMAGCRRRLALGLAVRLGVLRGQAGPGNPAENIAALVARFNGSAGAYARNRELAEEISVLEKLFESVHEAGETPTLARALTAQGARIVSLVRSQGPAEPSSEAAPRGTQLRLKKEPERPSPNELIVLKGQLAGWFDDCHRTLEALVEEAERPEGA